MWDIKDVRSAKGEKDKRTVIAASALLVNKTNLFFFFFFISLRVCINICVCVSPHNVCVNMFLHTVFCVYINVCVCFSTR